MPHENEISSFVNLNPRVASRKKGRNFLLLKSEKKGHSLTRRPRLSHRRLLVKLSTKFPRYDGIRSLNFKINFSPLTSHLWSSPHFLVQRFLEWSTPSVTWFSTEFLLRFLLSDSVLSRQVAILSVRFAEPQWRVEAVR